MPTIRPFLPTDAPHLADLHRQSIRQIGSRHYSPEQVAAWESRAPSARRVLDLASDGRTTLVAQSDEGVLLGYIDLEEDGHIDRLYCSPEAVGTGVAAALLARLEMIASEKQIPRLYSEASEAALRFFRSKGFTLLHRRDLDIQGVAIHNYAVEKVLVGHHSTPDASS